MIKCILVDFGGVLTKNSDFKEFHKVGHEWIPIEELLARWHKAKVDEITLDQFLEGVPNKQEYLNGYYSKERFAPGYRKVLKTLRKKYVLCMLSNHITDMLLPLIKEKKIDKLFDEVLISGKGLAKPNPEFFLFACKILGLKTSECVLIDDLKGNIGSAKKNRDYYCVGK